MEKFYYLLYFTGGFLLSYLFDLVDYIFYRIEKLKQKRSVDPYV